MKTVAPVSFYRKVSKFSLGAHIALFSQVCLLSMTENILSSVTVTVTVTVVIVLPRWGGLHWPLDEKQPGRLGNPILAGDEAQVRG